MSYEQAIAALNDQWSQGDMDSDEYALERERLDYERGEMMSAQDAPEVAA
ncbi:hypothetical protein FIU88_08060 [Halomonas sp. THAF12]|nr:hypothetical protein [Halomonas sp. THAF12]QFT84927.1 hypothetical protein FIU88_08060 [Halomonas sp. THAF12]